MPDSVRPVFKWEWNINTLAVMMGFIGGFIAWGYTLAEMRTGREQNARDIVALTANFSALAARVDLIERAQAKMDQLDYRITSNEKANEALDTRLNRLSENYANRFADINTQLSTISVQIALVNQTTQEIKANTPAKR